MVFPRGSNHGDVRGSDVRTWRGKLLPRRSEIIASARMLFRGHTSCQLASWPSGDPHLIETSGPTDRFIRLWTTHGWHSSRDHASEARPSPKRPEIRRSSFRRKHDSTRLSASSNCSSWAVRPAAELPELHITGYRILLRVEGVRQFLDTLLTFSEGRLKFVVQCQFIHRPNLLDSILLSSIPSL